MKITLIGCGCSPDSLTREALEAVEQADLLVGTQRLLDWFSGTAEKQAAVMPEEMLTAVRSHKGGKACVLFSGDSGFCSGARLLLPRLQDEECVVLPGVSSLQVLAARLGESWRGWRLCTAHGVDCDPVTEVCHGQKVFFLTGGRLGPAQLCRMLTGAGLGWLATTVAENLGTEQERIVRGSASELSEACFAPLSVMLCEAAPRQVPRVPGLPDEMFERAEKVPMTKQEVRAVALACLGIGAEDVCWDVGAGTGSVSVELALQAKSVWAVEQEEAALALARRNREKLGAWNLRLVAGTAPEALAALPRPDAVFIGGSGGKLEAILQAVYRANPKARLCVSAIALESVHIAMQTLRSLGYSVEVRQLSASRSRAAGEMTMMLAQNPVWLVLGRAG